MATTPNFNLYKPNRADNNVEVDTSLADNFTKIDTELQNNKGGLATHISNPNAHTSENISHADGSVKTALENHEERITDIELNGSGSVPPDLEGRLSNLESDIEGVLAPATFEAIQSQSYTFDEYRIGYVQAQLATLSTNVKSFGAKGDGVTDDTTAIQSAINKAQEIGADVFFPSGTYLITSTLSFSGVSLRGVQGSVFSTSSKGSRIKCATKTFTALDQLLLTADKLTFTVENLIIEGALTGLDVTYAVNSRFRNLYFTGCDKSIQLGSTGAVGLLFCTFENIYTQSCRESVNFTASSDNNNNVFINCMFRASDLSFTLDCVGGLGAVNNQFINCEFRADNGRGLLLGKARNTTLSNCYFENKANSIRFIGATSNTFLINPVFSLLDNTNTQGDTAFIHLTQRVSIKLIGGTTYLNTAGTTTGLNQFSSDVATDMNAVKVIDPMRHAGSMSVPFHATSTLATGIVVRASDGFDWQLTVNTGTGAVTGTKLT